MPNRPRTFRRTLLGVALVLPMLSGCITTAVWGGSVQEDGDGTSSLHSSGGRALSDNILVKILATPFALVLDICTYPFQAAMYGWDDDDDDPNCD